MNIITFISIAIIVFVFISYVVSVIRLSRFSSKIMKADDSNNLLQGNKEFERINNIYNCTKNIDFDGSKKTCHKADEYYYNSEFARCNGINLKHINSAPGILSGLGVLGTFVGLTISVLHFDSSDTSAIKTSIDNLLGGMGTAFITSLVGMALSAVYIWLQKWVYNKFDNAIAVFNQKLDLKYHISADDVMIAENEKSKIEMLQKLQDIQKSLLITDEEGVEVTTGNMILNLYEESEKQSQALESFTTDLSNELNASLGRTMDSSIVPLIQNLERSHETMNTSIEVLSNNIQSPATDFVTTAVNELQNSMTSMVNEFRDTISGQTVGQMETLSSNLAKAGEMLNELPQTMKAMSEKVANSFNDVKTIVSGLQAAIVKQQEEMIENTRSVNTTMAEQMQQNFNLASTHQHDIIVKITEHLDTTIHSLTSQLEKAVGSLNNQQTSLSESHSRSTREIERLLQSFGQSIANMHNANNESAGLLSSIQKASENLNGSTDKLKDLAIGLGDTTIAVIEQQKESSTKFEEIQQQNQELVGQLTTALNNAQKLLDSYTNDFDVIKIGLKEIFNGINEGLKDYSKTLRESTGEALAEYSDAMTKSTTGLKNIAEALEESAEELTDGIEKIKKLR